MIVRAYKYRLYPTEEQKYFFHTCFFVNRAVYNYALSVKKEAWEKEKQDISINQISKDITLMRKTFSFDPFLKASSDVKDFTLKNVDAAFKNFFRRVKQKEVAGYPKFKSAKNGNQSFQNRRIKIDFENGIVHLPKCKGVKIIIDRKLPLVDNLQTIEQTATITKTPTGKYFLSIVANMGVEADELKELDGTNQDEILGIDYGIYVPFALSDGEMIYHPFDYLKWEKRRKFYGKQLSKKVKGSSNWKKAKLQLARHYEKMTNRRSHFLQTLTTELSNSNYKAIVLEDLKMKNMSKKPKPKKREEGEGFEQNGSKRKAGLNRKLLNGAFGEFKRMLEYKCAEKGIHLIYVDPKFTSQKCPSCGHVDKENRDRKIQHKFLCVECGHADNADVNAAHNIKNKGLELLKVAI